MLALLLTTLLCAVQAERSPPPGIDLSPVKAPLDRMAAAVEKALGQVDLVKGDIFKAVSWTSLAGAVLLTVLAMQTIHLHGLAASKSNLNSTEIRP
jgi:hypothetical protein